MHEGGGINAVVSKNDNKKRILENICIRHEIDAVKEVEYWKCTFNLMCI
jgi:hypothetical protein